MLVLYYSGTGGTANLAKHIGRGVRAEGLEARLRTVPAVSTTTERTQPPVPEEGAVYCSKEELAACSALALGSPTRFGNIAAPLKYFLDGTTDIWMSGALTGKPGAVFCSSASLHGGQESTLLSMMVPLLHHGMLITGVPYGVQELNTTRSGGSPYGPTHFGASGAELSGDEETVAQALGRRLAQLAVKLS